MEYDYSRISKESVTRGTEAFTEDVEFYKTEPMLFFRCVLGSAWNNRVLFNLG